MRFIPANQDIEKGGEMNGLLFLITAAAFYWLWGVVVKWTRG